MSTPLPDPAEAREALSAARRMRAAWLLALERGEASWPDLVIASTRPGGEPLQRVLLRDIADAWLHLPSAAITARMAMLRRLSGAHPDRRLNVAWLLDNSATPGARLEMFIDAMGYTHADRMERVAGFPWNPSPAMREVVR